MIATGIRWLARVTGGDISERGILQWQLAFWLAIATVSAGVLAIKRGWP